VRSATLEGGVGLTIFLTWRTARCRLIEPAPSFLGGGKYGSEQAHLLSHHYRNETVFLSLSSENVDPKGTAAGHDEYTDLEHRLRSALAWTEAAYH